MTNLPSTRIAAVALAGAAFLALTPLGCGNGAKETPSADTAVAPSGAPAAAPSESAIPGVVVGIPVPPAEVAKIGAQLAAKGYGLTLGVHSRLESFAQEVIASAPAGNVYVNRTIVGAVVGVQPFGGSGLSGTGPKAGGPNYLPRFAEERAVSNNIAAQGGDPQLLNL